MRQKLNNENTLYHCLGPVQPTILVGQLDNFVTYLHRHSMTFKAQFNGSDELRVQC